MGQRELCRDVKKGWLSRAVWPGCVCPSWCVLSKELSALSHDGQQLPEPSWGCRASSLFQELEEEGKGSGYALELNENRKN